MQQGAYMHSPYATQPNQMSPPEMAMGNQAQYAQQVRYLITIGILESIVDNRSGTVL